MVARLLIVQRDLQNYRADTFDTMCPKLKLPDLKVFESKMSKGVVSDHQDCLTLEKVMRNLQHDQTTLH